MAIEMRSASCSDSGNEPEVGAIDVSPEIDVVGVMRTAAAEPKAIVAVVRPTVTNDRVDDVPAPEAGRNWKAAVLCPNQFAAVEVEVSSIVVASPK